MRRQHGEMGGAAATDMQQSNAQQTAQARMAGAMLRRAGVRKPSARAVNRREGCARKKRAVRCARAAVPPKRQQYARQSILSDDKHPGVMRHA